MENVLKRMRYLLLLMITTLVSSNAFANAMAIDKDKFLIYHGAGSFESSIVVVDVSDPNNPVQVNEIAVAAAPRSLFLDKPRNLLFVSKYSFGLEVLDVSDPMDPKLVGSRVEPSYELSVQDDIAYVATNKSYFEVLDTSNPANMQLLERIGYISYKDPTDPPQTHAARINNGSLWIGGIPNNVNVYRITAPGTLEFAGVGTNQSSTTRTNIGFGNNTAIIVNDILEIFDTTAVSLLDRISRVKGLIWTVGNHAYIGDKGDVRIFDLGDPANVLEVGIFRHSEEGVPGSPTGIANQGNILFILHPGAGNGFAVFDVSEPAAPVLLTRISNKYLGDTPEPEPEPEPIAEPEPNLAPTADAGKDLYKGPKENAQLDGTRSFDSDGSIERYDWLQVAGRNVTLSDAQSASPKFTTPRVRRGKTRTLTFQLTVTDDKGAQSSDTVNVFVSR